MALGGVATGNMKAKDELRVQGIMTYSGLRPMVRAWGENTTLQCHIDRKQKPWDHHSESIPLLYCASSHLHALVLLAALLSAMPLVVTLLDPKG